MVNFAQYGLLTILSALLVFHVLVLLKIIAYKKIWGGRLKTDTEMYRFEIVSVLINLFFLFTIFVHASFLTIDVPKKVMNVLLWVMTALFLFSAFGNAMSKNKLEQRLFTPTAIILAVFSLILAVTN